MAHSSISNQPAVPLEYSFEFTTKPFGVRFKNAFVSAVDKDCAAYGRVMLGSQLIKVENQSVEGLHPSEVMSIVLKYANEVLPLLMTFRKPVTRRVSSIKSYVLKKDTNIECNPRSIFLDIRAFYKLWRTLSSEILLHALLVCTSDEYNQLVRSTGTTPMKNDVHMANDLVFTNLLEWKDGQGLVLITNGTKKGKKSTFWQTFSDTLVTLMDPSTYNTSEYNALKLDMNQYKSLDSFKYDVSVDGIQNELVYAALNVNVIQEILYRSKVWLSIYDRYGVNINSDDQMSQRSSFDKEFDVLLEEVSSVWHENETNYKE